MVARVLSVLMVLSMALQLTGCAELTDAADLIEQQLEGEASEQFKELRPQVEEAFRQVQETVEGLQGPLKDLVDSIMEQTGREGNPFGTGRPFSGGSEEEKPAEEQKGDEQDPARKEMQDAFRDFLEKYVKTIVSRDYSTMHWLYTDPEAAGIDRASVEVTLGEVIADPAQTVHDAQVVKKALSLFNYDLLDTEQQGIYDALLHDAERSEKAVEDRFFGLDNIWSSSGGVHQVLVSHFSEYYLYSEQDVIDLVTLIRDIPRFVDEALSYTKQQADKGLLSFDYDTATSDILAVLDAQEDSAVLAALMDSVDRLGLPAEKAQEYKTQIRAAMEECFYPSYERMAQELTSLKDKVTPPAGLANLPAGKEYYELILADTGITDDVETVRSVLVKGMDDAMKDMQKLIARESDLVYLDPFTLKTGYQSIEEILADLEASYAVSFPQVGKMNYELDAISDERAADFSAYFVIPPVDNRMDYRIRYNANYLGTDAGGIDMFQTISHEGIPGHMYQAQYNREHLHYDIQYMNAKLTFSEGWATYAQAHGLTWIKSLSPAQVRFFTDYNTYLNTMGALMELEINYDGATLDQFKSKYSVFMFEDALEETYRHLADNVIYYMPYLYGYHKLTDLREKAEKALGKQFDETAFHNALLIAGSTDLDIVERNVDAYISAAKK